MGYAWIHCVVVDSLLFCFRTFQGCSSAVNLGITRFGFRFNVESPNSSERKNPKIVLQKNYGDRRVFRMQEHHRLRHLDISPKVPNHRVGGSCRPRLGSLTRSIRDGLLIRFFTLPPCHKLLTLIHFQTVICLRKQLYWGSHFVCMCNVFLLKFSPRWIDWALWTNALRWILRRT